MKRAIIATLALGVALVSTMAHGLPIETNHGVTVPLMLPAGSEYGQSFVRLRNHDLGEVTVRITAIDDAGNVFDPFAITLAPGQAFHFNSDDLTNGNASKGIEGIGTPAPPSCCPIREGNWRLRVEVGELEFVLVESFIRTRDGFLTATPDVLTEYQGQSFRDLYASTFNPASNTRQQSVLRLINWGSENEVIVIDAWDDKGKAWRAN